MRNMLAFLAAVALTVGGLGWYLDWFKVRSQPADAGHRSVTIDINTTKIGTDLHKGEQTIQQMLENNGKSRAAGKDGKGAPAENGGKLVTDKIPQPAGKGGPEKNAPGKSSSREVNQELSEYRPDR